MNRHRAIGLQRTHSPAGPPVESLIFLALAWQNAEPGRLSQGPVGAG